MSLKINVDCAWTDAAFGTVFLELIDNVRGVEVSRFIVGNVGVQRSSWNKYWLG